MKISGFFIKKAKAADNNEIELNIEGNVVKISKVKEEKSKPKKIKIDAKDCRILTDEEKEELRKKILEAEKEYEKAKIKFKEYKGTKAKKNELKQMCEDKKKLLEETKNNEKEMLKQEKKRLNYERMEINKFYKRWVEVMAYMGLYNTMSQTYALRNIKYEPYGFSANIHAPLGMSFMELETDKSIAVIQKNLKCVFITNDVPKSNHIEAKFIMKNLGFVDYKPIPLKPYEILLSQNIDGTPMVSNMLKYPHALIQGSTNMGKSKFIDIILTNLITTCNPEDLHLYILQADKSDQYPYAGCKHCKCYTDDIDSSFAMLNHLLKIIEERNRALKQYNYYGICNNIFEYNEAIKKNIIKDKTKWNYMYLVIDEYATLMPESSFGKDKKIKQAIQAIMERIIQIGRSVGLYCILSTQRSTIDKMPSFVKANCMTIISFKVPNKKSSEIALDSSEAVNLKQREFITKIEKMSFGQTYNLTQKQIVEYIKPFRYKKVPKFEFKAEDISNIIKENSSEETTHKRKTKSERKKAKREIEKILEETKRKEEEELKKIKEKIENSNNDEIEFKIKEKKEKLKLSEEENNINLKIKEKKEKVKLE